MTNRKGFTLVELLAVIVILAIIMIISIPSVLNTMNSARQKTFGQYVTKIYSKAIEKKLQNDFLGISKDKYDITTDLDLSNTGDYKGYVLFVDKGTEEDDVYIALTNGEYITATQYGNNVTDVVNYINYTAGGEPEFASSLSKFNGENKFIRATSTDVEISIPDSQDSPNFIELKKHPSESDDFNTKLKVFYNKSYEEFRKSIINDTVTKKYYTCDENHDHGFVYRGVYEYKAITGDTDPNSNGFIIFIDSRIKDDFGNPFPLNQALVLFRDTNYHTASYITTPQGESIVSVYSPYVLYGRIIDDLSKISTNLSSAPIDFNLINYLQGLNNIQHTATDEETSASLFNQLTKTYMPNITYVSNSFDDNLTSNLYTPSGFINNYGFEPDAIVDALLSLNGIYPKS